MICSKKRRPALSRSVERPSWPVGSSLGPTKITQNEVLGAREEKDLLQISHKQNVHGHWGLTQGSHVYISGSQDRQLVIAAARLNNLLFHIFTFNKPAYTSRWDARTDFGFILPFLTTKISAFQTFGAPTGVGIWWKTNYWSPTETLEAVFGWFHNRPGGNVVVLHLRNLFIL